MVVKREDDWFTQMIVIGSNIPSQATEAVSAGSYLGNHQPCCLFWVRPNKRILSVVSCLLSVMLTELLTGREQQQRQRGGVTACQNGSTAEQFVGHAVKTVKQLLDSS